MNRTLLSAKTLAVLLVIFITSAAGLKAQERLTLGDCYSLAEKKSLISQESEKYSEVWQLKDASLKSNWYPVIDAGANIIYNSEVIDMSSVFSAIPVPGLAGAIKPMPHDQYKATVEISQTIYDGGATRNARKAELAELELNRKQSESDLYGLRSQVNNCFFSILLAGKQKELLNLFLALLEEKKKAAESGLRNGVVTESDLDALVSEILKTRQQIDEADIKIASLLNVLGNLIGKSITGVGDLAMPSLNIDPNPSISRPELALFDLRKTQLEATANLIDSRRKPKAFGFATLGYGNPPGNNFLKDEFAPYYMLGAGLKWNIHDWNRSKNEKQVIRIKEDILTGRKSETEEAFKRSLAIKEGEIRSLQAMTERDTELIALRKKISAAAVSKFENGTITAAELLNELNSEKQALLSYETHRLGLELAKAEYLNISGNNLK